MKVTGRIKDLDKVLIFYQNTNDFSVHAFIYFKREEILHYENEACEFHKQIHTEPLIFAE